MLIIKVTIIATIPSPAYGQRASTMMTIQRKTFKEKSIRLSHSKTPIKHKENQIRQYGK